MVDRRERSVNTVGFDDETTVLIQRLLGRLRPSQSGLLFALHGTSIFVDGSINFPVTDGDEELFKWYQNRHRLSYAEFANDLSYDEYRRDIIEKARSIAPRRFMGGIGVTNRTNESFFGIMPDVEREFYEEVGKVVFLGNGFCRLPLEIAWRFSQGLVREPPLVVDVFDYGAAWQDVLNLIHTFDEHGIKPLAPLRDVEINLRQIVEAKRRGWLKSENYYVGSGRIPDSMRAAALVINCFGPSLGSLDEQLEMLAPDGVLYYVGLDGRVVRGRTV